MKQFLNTIEFDQKIIKSLETADTRVLNVIDKLQQLQKTYQDKGLSNSFFIQSIYDIERRLLINLNQHNKLTLFDREMKWVNMILDFKIFKIGSLRFQLFPMHYEEIIRSGKDYMPLSDLMRRRFPPNLPLINIHIEKETDLSHEAVESSIQQARHFFSEVFPNYKFEGFVTRTWLIYPGIISLLEPTSNIYKFAHRFEIIATNQATYQALSRVYATEDLETIKNLPKKTSLEKSIYQNLDRLGVAFGYFPF